MFLAWLFVLALGWELVAVGRHFTKEGNPRMDYGMNGNQSLRLLKKSRHNPPDTGAEHI